MCASGWIHPACLRLSIIITNGAGRHHLRRSVEEFTMESVFAIIVTYNRKALLRECLEAVLGQSHTPSAVIVINNASTDGTAEMLEAEFADRVTRVNMAQNVGGGGGFYHGMQLAYQAGADWLWLMDDDGYPEHHSLAAMMSPINTKSLAVMNPLVVCRNNSDELSFGLEMNGAIEMSVRRVLEHLGPSRQFLGQINPFNGTLISRVAVEKIGFPRYEMFIWGDEVDYAYRMKKAGLKIATITDSIHRHPPAVGQRIDLGVFGSIDIKHPDRIGISARNMGYIYRKHRSMKLKWLKPVIVAAYYLSRGDFRICYNFARYYVDGYLDRYSLAPSRSSLSNVNLDVMPIARRQSRDIRIPVDA